MVLLLLRSRVSCRAQRSASSRLIFLTSLECTSASAARRRVRVDGFFSNRCWRIACSRRSLPLPVFLNRLAAVFDVFIFGITGLLLGGLPARWRRSLRRDRRARR